MHQPLTLTLLADQPLLVALVAVVLEMVLPLPASVRPSALVPLLERLARKVNYRQSPPAQQWVAGLLTPLVVLIPSVAGCWALRNLTLSETLFDLLLLCWLLEGRPLRQQLAGMLPGGGHALRAAWRARRDWPGGAQGMLVAAVAGGIGLRLGGPRCDAGEKVRYPILGGGPGGGAEPQADSPLRVRSRLRWLAAIWLLLSLLMEGLWLYVYTR